MGSGVIDVPGSPHHYSVFGQYSVKT